MPAPELSERRQIAVLWTLTGLDEFGNPVKDEPIEIFIRWITGRSESINPNGDPMALDATLEVTQRIDIGSLLWLGTLQEWLEGGSAGDDTELMEVKTYSETPDVKARWRQRTVGLTYFRDTP